MHAIKGSWVGQTFALAKLNESESGGRKARVRRSKEERKTMAESFIKKYQKLNNGSFPSLSLTHKEVGGSFYTVREIVREIIQENRVLGPAKLTNNKTDIFSEQYPLGTISVEPQIHLDSSKETPTVIHIVPNQYQGQSEELALNLNGQYNEVQHLTSVDRKITNIDSEICTEGEKIEEENVSLETRDETLENGKFVNGHNVEIGRKEEIDEFKSIESEICIEGEKIEEENVILETRDETVENGKFVNGHSVEIGRKEECDELKSIESEMCESTAEVTEMKTEIVIETFPLRPVSNTTTTFGVDKRKTDENEAVTDSEEISSCLAPEKVEANLAADSLLKSSFLSGDEVETSFQKDVSHETDLKDEDELPAQNQPMNEPNGVCVDNLINTDTHDSHVPLISEEAVEINNIKQDIQLRGEPTKIRDPTLDRINLESWEATSKKSGRSEINPFFKTIKAFVAAFIKFWSE